MDGSLGELRVLHAGDGVGVAEVGNVCVVLWRGSVTRTRFHAQKSGLATVISRHPEGVGFLCVIEPTSGPPDDELRRASAKMVAEHQPSIRSIACVVEGSGFRSAVARSALSAIALIIGRRSMPLSVFGQVGPAAEWLGPRVGQPHGRALAAHVEQLRSRLAPEPLDG